MSKCLTLIRLTLICLTLKYAVSLRCFLLVVQTPVGSEPSLERIMGRKILGNEAQ